ERREYEHRRAHALLAQEFDEREPVHVREHSVGDDEIVSPLGRLEESLAPIARMIDGVATLAQPLQQELRGFLIVLDEEQMHQRLPVPTSEPMRASPPGPGSEPSPAALRAAASATARRTSSRRRRSA